jgi:hypothetical protein
MSILVTKVRFVKAGLELAPRILVNVFIRTSLRLLFYKCVCGIC